MSGKLKSLRCTGSDNFSDKIFQKILKMIKIKNSKSNITHQII